jgi:hypothetical protein
MNYSIQSYGEWWEEKLDIANSPAVDEKIAVI